jgi:hypothetical protein
MEKCLVGNPTLESAMTHRRFLALVFTALSHRMSQPNNHIGPPNNFCIRIVRKRPRRRAVNNPRNRSRGTTPHELTLSARNDMTQC